MSRDGASQDADICKGLVLTEVFLVHVQSTTGMLSTRGT